MSLWLFNNDGSLLETDSAALNSALSDRKTNFPFASVHPKWVYVRESDSVKIFTIKLCQSLIQSYLRAW